MAVFTRLTRAKGVTLMVTCLSSCSKNTFTLTESSPLFVCSPPSAFLAIALANEAEGVALVTSAKRSPPLNQSDHVTSLPS